MKKTLTLVTLLAGAVAVYSQGTVNVQDYGSSFQIHVYNNQTAQPTGNVTAYSVTYNGYTSGTEYYGNVSNDKPTASSGNAVYNTGTALSGTGFDAQLLAAANTGDALSTLSTLGTVYNYYTSATLKGLWSGGVNTVIAAAMPGPASEGGTGATVAIAAWVNNGTAGAATSLATAQADGYAWGISPLLSINSLGGTPSGYTPVTPPFLAGEDSFSIAQSIPEPSTIALGVMGASALLFRRRK